MKSYLHIYIVIWLLGVASCTNKHDYVLLELEDSWLLDTTIYSEQNGYEKNWIYYLVGDSIHCSGCLVTKVYTTTIDQVSVTKRVTNHFGANREVNIVDTYHKPINQYLESRLHIGYHFESNSFYCEYTDSVGRQEVVNSNQLKADSTMQYAQKEGLYLCGTAYNEILHENVIPYPKSSVIELDSALKIKNAWLDQKM